MSKNSVVTRRKLENLQVCGNEHTPEQRADGKNQKGNHKYLDINKYGNTNTTCQNSQDAEQAVLRGKLIDKNSSIKKKEALK